MKKLFLMSLVFFSDYAHSPKNPVEIQIMAQWSS